MKKNLKIGLITGASILVAGGAWACATKLGYIPNWLKIEELCPGIEKIVIDDIDTNNEMIDNSLINKFSDIEKDDNHDENYRGGKEVFDEQDRNPMDVSEEAESDPKIRRSYEMRDYKPIIYLYPEKETLVNIKLGTSENLSHTYPKYNTEKGRNIIAQPNGVLEDMDTGRKLYALYREGKSDIETNFKEGFVVAGKNIIPFLEEKLAILGLNEREAEEFIVYWLPQMEGNERNLIRFESIEEQNENMPLNITPTPDTVIRVMMDWKATDESIDIPEQQLTTPERSGFTVVEWGGSPRN